MKKSGELPPAFYCYGTCDPFYDQFLAKADAVEYVGVQVELLQLDGSARLWLPGRLVRCV